MIQRVLVHSKQALLMLLVMTVLLGGILPAVFTLASQLVFHHAAGGSLIEKDGRVIGSSLLGQEFAQDKYFWGRMSATIPPYNASASGASNYSMGNSQLLEKANERMARLPADQKIPLSLVTSSGSGLDPHITPQAALFQVARVAKARKISSEELTALVEAHTEEPYLGMIGTKTVNVLLLNLALDERYAR